MADNYYVTDQWGRTSMRKLTDEQAQALDARPVVSPAPEPESEPAPKRSKSKSEFDVFPKADEPES